MEIVVSDYIIEFLIKKNIETIFTLSGGFIGPILNSIEKYTSVKYFCFCHEQSAAMAADAYARIARKPCCLLVTNGPGSSNTLTGVIGAYQDSIPIFIISGNCPLEQSLDSQNLNIRQLGVQELNIIPIAKHFTNYSHNIKNKDELIDVLNIAYDKCISGRMGPVWIDIPLDVQKMHIKHNLEEKKSTLIETCNKNVNYELLIDKIINSKKPLFLIGNGIWLSKTENIFRELLKKTKIPVVSSWLGKDILNCEEPLYFGNIGILGERHANYAVQKADLLIILGCRLTITQIGYDYKNFSKESYKIMVDIDENEMNKKTIDINFKINEDMHLFLTQLNKSSSLERLNGLKFENWEKRLNLWREKYSSYDNNIIMDGHVNSYYFSKILSNSLKDNTTIVTDTGSSSFSIFQSLKINKKNIRLFTASGQCSMGYGLPGSIGAYVADDSKPLILIAGDGGFQMNIQELQTIIYHKIPIKIFILNNDGYLAIKLMQSNLFNKNYVASSKKSGVSSPDFIKVAESYGLKTFSINSNNEVDKIVKEVIDYQGCCLCNITMIEDQLIVPRVQSNGSKASLEYMFPFIDEEELISELEI